MPKKISITIEESQSELKSFKRKASSRLIEDRIQALIYLKQGKYHYQSRLAAKLGYTDKTVREWLNLYCREGIRGYTRTSRGGKAPSKISPETHELLQSLLFNPNSTITSYKELNHLLKQEHGVDVCYMTLYGYCRRKFRSKLKVARKSHHKKDPLAVEAFKKTPLPYKGNKTKD